MLQINKNYVLDQNQKPIAVQIPITEFEQIEEILENYGLAKLMEEVETDEILSKHEALKYLELLKFPATGIINNLTANPIKIVNFQPLTREEANERP